MEKIKFEDVHECVEHINAFLQAGVDTVSRINKHKFPEDMKKSLINDAVKTNQTFVKTRELLLTMYAMIEDVKRTDEEVKVFGKVI